jgi:hypothetical protein
MGLTWRQVMAWRLRRHQLHERAPAAGDAEVVTAIGGLHAQVFSSAELSLWARQDGLAAGDLERSLWEERRYVKTWAMRGTLHLIPAARYPVVQAGLGTYDHYLKPVWFRNFGVTQEELELLIRTVGEALDGTPLTRAELADEVAKRTGSESLAEKVRESWGALLKPASFRGRLCFAPNLGQNVRFTRPDRWLGRFDPVDPAAALTDITRRYLAAYGPATREDFARWWGVMPARAKALLTALGDEATRVEVEGAEQWVLADDVAEVAAATASRSVRLLPAFDPWVIGASRSVDALVAGGARSRIYRPQGWISPVLVVNGRMDGVWKHERSGNRLEVRVEPFVPVPAWARKAAEAEAERLATFLGGALEVTWDA